MKRRRKSRKTKERLGALQKWSGVDISKALAAEAEEGNNNTHKFYVLLLL